MMDSVYTIDKIKHIVTLLQRHMMLAIYIFLALTHEGKQPPTVTLICGWIRGKREGC